MPTGKIKMFDEGRGFGFIKPDDGGVDVFFHVSALRDGDEITQGKAVKFEIGVDPKSGKTKAVSVEFDLKAPLSVDHANATREAWPLLPRER
jgi:cold shock protein